MLTLTGVGKRYPTGDRALTDIQLSLPKGQVMALIGPSGAGKSTLIRCVNRLVEPTQGSIRLEDVELTKLSGSRLRHARRSMGMIFQEYALVDRLSVMENVLSGQLGYVGFWRSFLRRYPQEAVAEAFRLLERVGLPHAIDKRADALSGGQRQRVGIARALLQSPKLLLVDEPTEADTIAILRGLKERYEVHHGVDITDSAIIAAAKLSTRYITDRQLPDKAIDLIDEAASRIRMELDSKPEEMDRLDRRLIQLKMEREALKKETDEASKKRLEALNNQIHDLEREYADLDEIWKAEKASIQGAAQFKAELEQARIDLEQARRQGDLGRMSEIQYGKIPALEKKISEAGEGEADTASHQLLRSNVTEEEIAEVVSRWTGIPVSKMLEGERDKLLRMEDALHERVIGQHEAVEAVANAVRRSRAGLADPNRPNGSFLFLGPTGVGKTELCKSLANFLFDTEEAMVRIDMSEFMEKHSVARLIGAPPGYVGYEEGGYLTEAVRRKPYSVLLLDEVEKAHPDVFNILLQVLEDGRLTDGQGRTVDFRNTVIVMTSNMGSDIIQRMGGDDNDYELMKNAVMEVVGNHFRPELINRIDEVVVFHALGQEQIQAIAGIQLERLKGRLAEHDLSLEISDDAMAQLAVVGFDPVFGARPLKRAIQSRIENPLAQNLLAGKYAPGDTIHISANEGELVFS